MKKLLALLTLTVSVLSSVNWVQAASIVVVGPEAPVYDYTFGLADHDLYLAHDSDYGFEVSLTNTGTVPWYTDGTDTTQPLRLATVRPHDQEVSMFYNPLMARHWVSANRIRASEITIVNPLETINFRFSIKAPTIPGKYLFALAPVIEGVTFLPGDPLLVTLIVDDDATPTEQYNTATLKRLLVNRATQQMHQQIGGDDVDVHIVSTGKAGMDTPVGNFYVHHKQDVRYSSAYNLYMDNWIGLTRPGYGFQGYGIHKLPYWKTKSGRIYEGEAHLGRRVSHGCVRLGYEESKTVFDWVEEGMLVKVI